MQIRQAGRLSIVWLLAAAAGVPVAAQTGGDATAQGWRSVHDGGFAAAAGDRKWTQDFGVMEGRCNKAAVADALDVERTASGRAVAALNGTIAVGKSARAPDPGDRACLAHALELAPEGRAVFWFDSTAGYAYRATALRSFTATGWPCREFILEIGKVKQAVPEVVRGRACRTEDGVWGMVT